MHEWRQQIVGSWEDISTTLKFIHQVAHLKEKNTDFQTWHEFLINKLLLKTNFSSPKF